jgi:hypothetical protein
MGSLDIGLVRDSIAGIARQLDKNVDIQRLSAADHTVGDLCGRAEALESSLRGRDSILAEVVHQYVATPLRVAADSRGISTALESESLLQASWGVEDLKTLVATEPGALDAALLRHWSHQLAGNIEYASGFKPAQGDTIMLTDLHVSASRMEAAVAPVNPALAQAIGRVTNPLGDASGVTGSHRHVGEDLKAALREARYVERLVSPTP